MSSTPDVPRDLFEHAAFVRRLARSLLLDAQAAEDAAQETWRAALERPPRANVRAWLGRVTRNLALRHRRSEGRRAEREERRARDARDQDAGPEELLAREETLRRVTLAVSGLGEPYRATVLARYYEDLPPRAIARRDGVPVETVRTRLKRAHVLLRARLGERGADWRGSLGLLLAPHQLPWSSSGPAAWMAVMKTKTWMLVVVGALGLVAAVRVSSLLAGGRSPAPDEILASQPAERPLAEADVIRPPEEGAARAAVPATAHAAGLSGRVFDESGAGVAQASIFVLGARDPFPEGHPAQEVRCGNWYGRVFTSDAEGRWSARLDAGRVLVALGPGVGFEPLGPREECWVEAPAAGLDFAVRRVATATLLVRAVDGATREPLRDFRITVHGPATVLPDGRTSYAGMWTLGAVDGLAREELPATEPAGTRRSVLLYVPGADEPLPEQEVVLLPGETRELVFVVPERGVVRGFVVDPEGQPIPGALVFLGAEARARGDEPFKLFRETRVADGVRTAADGWFELPGDGDLVTAWHPLHSPATVPVAQAGRIVLAPRGALRGRLLDAGRAPVAGVELALDEPRDGPRAVTGADGGFAFEGLEGGAHALWGRDEELLACVRLAPGEELALELLPPPPQPTMLAIEGVAGGLEGVVVGLEQVFALQEVETEDAREPIEFAGALPAGRYWLCTRQGIAAGFALADGAATARAQAGDAPLVVRAAARTGVQVVPAEADPLLRLLAARCIVWADSGAPARFRLAPGSYLLVGRAGRVLRAVDVGPRGAEITLD